VRERRPHRRRPAGIPLLCTLPILLGLLAWLGIAAAPAGAKTIHFRGEQVRVPAGWPVYRLAQHPGMCVRLDRRAVYLGSPAANQRCPAEAAVGRRRAILVDPAARERSPVLPVAPRALAGSSASGATFTGLGFDACSAPSSRSMAAWGESPYRAIGVYIGGINRACSQPNLTATWVSAQTAAGWHLIPTYVGRQAPYSSCSSCAKLSGANAAAQGAADAEDAVAQAAAVAIGPGSPIYFDMESYTRTSSATAAVLAFLEAWTRKLHALGYVSGVYSSSASGIADLAAKIGSGYLQPDDLWIANWNGQKSTSDPVVPASAWSQHQRIHQYRGGHDETYGGVTINIDNDYVDGATVGDATLPTSPDDPVGWLDLAAAPGPGQVRIRGWAFDPDEPTATLDVRVAVGGREGGQGVSVYDLGPIANRVRKDVAAAYPEAGNRHGFDASFFAGAAGAQPICVYAGNTGLGSDRLLGCKATRIPVSIALSHVHPTKRGVRVRIECQWPGGTECPGRLQLRTRFKAVVGRRHGRVRLHTVTRNLGRRRFHLGGERAHAYLIPFSGGGRTLLRLRGKLRTYLIAAVPGGRRVKVLAVEQK
jgi:Rv2525c-like, glycoside hydrolase-like domain